MSDSRTRPERLADAPCPSCGAEGAVVRLGRPETVEVRGCPVTVERVFRRCEKCGAEFENSRDPDWKPAAFTAFRGKNGYLQPEQIRAWRKALKLTQAEVSALLGWGEATLGRYETGSLQTEAHERQMRALMSPSGLAEALKSNPAAVDDAKREAVVARIQEELVQERARQMFDAIAGIHEPDILSGNQVYSFDKVAALVAALAGAGEFKTKLNKLMFYADFICFRQSGRAISGLRYARAALGPVPDQYETLFAALETGGIIRRTEVPVGDGYGETIIASGKPAARAFSKAEAAAIEKVRRRFARVSAKAIVETSHAEEAWQATASGHLVSYEFARTLKAV